LKLIIDNLNLTKVALFTELRNSSYDIATLSTKMTQVI